MDLSRTTLAAVIGTTDRLGGAEKAFRAIVTGLRAEYGMKLRIFVHVLPEEPDSDFEVTVLGQPDRTAIGRMLLNLRRELLALEGPAILFPFQINSNVLAMAVNQSLPRRKRLPAVLNDRAHIDETLAVGANSSLLGRLAAPLRRQLTLRSYRAGDHIVCNARANERDVLRFTGLDASRVSTIYNPLAAKEIQARFPTRDRSVLVTSASPLIAVHARMNEQKGLDSLLRAFAAVKQVHPGARLRMVGDGPERDALEALATELGIESSCELPGFLSDPISAIEDADIYVLPSRWEGLPNALLEAIAVGLPVVATRCPTGPEEILENGQVGRLVEVDDVAAIAKNVLDLIGDSDERQRLGQRARSRALDFGLEVNLAAYRAVFEQVVASKS